jgi:hypothetical protein
MTNFPASVLATKNLRTNEDFSELTIETALLFEKILQIFRNKTSISDEQALVTLTIKYLETMRM